MNPTLVNNHVLFALGADRKMAPEWSRVWRNEIAVAVTAAETRRSLRAQPRVRLEFLITPRTLAEQIELGEGVMAARKSGLACAPYHGRSSQLQAAAAGPDVNVSVHTGYGWAVGDWIFLRAETGLVEVRQLTAVSFVDEVWTLEFADPLDDSYAAGSLVWPLLFGEFACEEMAGRSPQCGPIQIAITELVSARTAQVGAEEAPSGAGIGVWKIEDTFIVQ